MPELPEVETVRQGIEPVVVGRQIVDGWGHVSSKFSGAIEAVGATFEAVGRRGKYLLFELDDDRELVVHLGMTGQLARSAGTSDPYLRAWWELDDGGFLTYRDVRRFGRLGVVDRGDHARFPTLAAQGPEPWDAVLDEGGLWTNLRRSNAKLKTQLLSQRPIAGVGNIYADEALWDAEINPSARSLSRPRADRLLAALRHSLEGGLANGGTTLRDYRNVDGGEGTNQRQLRCYGRSGEPCLRCGEPLRRKIIDGRSTTWCPSCQRR